MTISNMNISNMNMIRFKLNNYIYIVIDIPKYQQMHIYIGSFYSYFY